jgi:hypothetical protein
MVPARPSSRLTSIRGALGRAIVAAGTTGEGTYGEETTGEGTTGEPGQQARRQSPAHRRRGASWLVAIWRDVACDIAMAQLGGDGLRDPDLLEETRAAASTLPSGSMTGFIRCLDETASRLDASASPELALDVLALCWPGSRAASISDRGT